MSDNDNNKSSSHSLPRKRSEVTPSKSGWGGTGYIDPSLLSPLLITHSVTIVTGKGSSLKKKLLI